MSYITILGRPLSNSWATSFVERPFTETVGEAPLIVRGRIGMTYTNWVTGSDNSRRIFTFYELQIDEVFKGELAEKTLIFREIGGEKGGVGMQVPGSAHFDKGEDVIIMLSKKNPDQSYNLLGMMMGKYNIEKDDQGKEVLRGAGLNGTALGGVVFDEETKRRQSGSLWTLDTLREIVKKQSGGKSQSSTPQKSVTNPAPIPSQNGGVKASQRLSSPAPSLQPQESEEAQGLPSWIKALGLIVGILTVFGLFRRILK